MTIQQLQYVLEIAKTGSISQAARNLFLSQPNISGVLKSLERELGIEIFLRTNTGMVPTPQGAKFIRRASGILSEMDALLTETTGQQVSSFTMNAAHYIPALEAFEALCQRYADRPSIQLSCFSEPRQGIRDIIELVSMGVYDLYILVSESSMELDYLCRRNCLQHLTLMESPLCVHLAKGHPLAAPGRFDPQKLRLYPYVDYITSEDLTLGPPMLKYIHPERIIRVQSITSRREIVAHTNAFSMVMPHSRAYNDRHGLVNRPLPELRMRISCVYSKANASHPVLREYLAIFGGMMEQIQADFQSEQSSGRCSL